MHVGLEYALCSRCMCLIEAFTRCDAFPVPQFNLDFSSQVRKGKCLLVCSRSVKVGFSKRLGLFKTRNRVALRSLHFRIHTMHGE